MTAPKFMALTDNGRVKPTGRIYLASMPIAQQLPDAGPFYVHQAIPSRTGWTVSDSRTGLVIGHGPTRATAMENATRTLLYYGQAGYDKAVQMARLRSTKP